METIKLITHIDDTGTLHLELPTHLANHEVEVLVVLQPTPRPLIDVHGYPSDYFEALDAIEADDMIERPEQGIFEVREPLQ